MEDKPRLYTTHCSPHKKPKLIGRPAIINGKQAIAYVSGEQIESYLFLEEVQKLMNNNNLPKRTVSF